MIKAAGERRGIVGDVEWYLRMYGAAKSLVSSYRAGLMASSTDTILSFSRCNVQYALLDAWVVRIFFH